jgi:hypothetical protein
VSLSCAARGKLFFVQPNRRTGKLLHHGRDFLNTTCGASEGVETLKADQGEEDIDRLIEGFRSRLSVLLEEPRDDDTKTLPSPFVSCLYHVFKIRVEGGQSSEPAHHKPIGVPKATKDANVFIQSVERFGATEGVCQVLHPSMGCKGVAQGFEEPDFGAKLVIDGHAGDVGLVSDSVNAKAREAWAFREQFARRSEDAGTRLFGGGLTLTKSVGAWTHR